MSKAWKENLNRHRMYQTLLPQKSLLKKCKSRSSLEGQQQASVQQVLSQEEVNKSSNQIQQTKKYLKAESQLNEQIKIQISDASFESIKSSKSLFDQQLNQKVESSENLLMPPYINYENNYIVKKFLQRTKTNICTKENVAKDENQPSKGDLWEIRLEKSRSPTSKTSSNSSFCFERSLTDFTVKRNLQENLLEDNKNSEKSNDQERKSLEINADANQILKLRQAHNWKLLPTQNKTVQFNMENSSIKRGRSKKKKQKEIV